MAVSESSNNHDARQNLPKSQIEAVLSVPPMKVTDPRHVRRVSITDTDTDRGKKTNDNTIWGCYQIVLYYEKLKKEEYDDGGMFLAGWIRDSLGKALLEEPLLAGRIQRKEHDKKVLEIVSNDSGVRLYEARIPMRLSEFLALKEKEHVVEGELVFWKEIDEQSVEFSPLVYVQVTKFECGGYSIGVSSSLVLFDVLIIENFIKKWSQIHNNSLSPQIEEHYNYNNKTPIFYHPILINEPPPSSVLSTTPTKKESQHTMLFKIKNSNMEQWRELAMICVEETEQILQKNIGSDFLVLVKESSSEDIKIHNFSKSGYIKNNKKVDSEIVGGNWNDFGGYGEVAFQEGNKAVHVSHWIGSSVDVGYVIIAFPHVEENNGSAVVIVSLLSQN
ncbi:hypothetical protein PIB30_005899 [Stylosanthes scabra]|uniref:Uncharacterized protein n=1 Tax=Stylosanthes scabra TaxID=79078 RepID=A0ABU6R431_9FABA|nr:hypothetical protein [Stylosanthes scabra]